jgi:hypothetical protein
MNFRVGFVIVAMALSFALQANAQVLFSAPVSITQNASDLSILGGYVDAVGANDYGNSSFGSAITVGDTTFHSIFSDSGITLSNAGGGSDGSGSTATAFKAVLDGVDYTGNFNPADVSVSTVTLNNLKVGDVYQVQVFSLGYFETEINGSNSVDLRNQYTIGTFTATGAGVTTSQTFTFDSSVSGIGEVNAISLRDLSVPEPGTWALLGLGLGFLVLIARGRGLLAGRCS